MGKSQKKRHHNRSQMRCILPAEARGVRAMSSQWLVGLFIGMRVQSLSELWGEVLRSTWHHNSLGKNGIVGMLGFMVIGLRPCTMQDIRAPPRPYHDLNAFLENVARERSACWRFKIVRLGYPFPGRRVSSQPVDVSPLSTRPRTNTPSISQLALHQNNVG